MTKPKYKIIADHVRDKVVSKQWLEGDRIPSETELSELFLASRMTARKAVEQLVAEGLLERSPSIGTFVKAPKAQSSLLEIKNIRDEILERGHEHKVVVLSKNSLVPNDKVALELSSWDVKVYKVVILHFENNTPIQLEERYVNASFVPEFLDQDFTKKTSSEYLNKVAPLSEAKMMVEAIMPSKILSHHLNLNENVPCLKITRTTFSSHTPISICYLYYPADKYRVTSHLLI